MRARAFGLVGMLLSLALIGFLTAVYFRYIGRQAVMMGGGAPGNSPSDAAAFVKSAREQVNEYNQAAEARAGYINNLSDSSAP